MNILKRKKKSLIILSELLIEREVLDFDDVDSIMKTGKLSPNHKKKKTPQIEEKEEENNEKQQPEKENDKKKEKESSDLKSTETPTNDPSEEKNK